MEAGTRAEEMGMWNQEWESSDLQTRQRQKGWRVGDGLFSVNKGEELRVLFLLSPIVPFICVTAKYRCASARKEFILKKG